MSPESVTPPDGSKLPDIIGRRNFLRVTTATLCGVAAGDFVGGIPVTARSPGEKLATAPISEDEMMIKNKDGNDLEFLKNYSTTVLESAIALLRGGSHQTITVTRPGLTLRQPELGRLVGYAVTSSFSTDPDDDRGRKDNLDYWNYAYQISGPKVAVSFDASAVPGTGSSWGQLNAHIHQALGCRGVITNGGVRDLEVFRDIRLQVMSAHLTVGHGNPHFLTFGEPLNLFGATIHSQDIICADEHGALVVPREMLPQIEEAAEEVRRRVSVVAQYCRTKDFSPAGLAEAARNMKPTIKWTPARKH